MALFIHLRIPYHLLLLVIAAASLYAAPARTACHDFKIQYVNVTRICHTKTIVSVNGQFPGPTVYVDEGDDVEVNVTNLVENNVTIHWHGVRQLLSAWSDGPAQITQCPIQTGKSFVHRFKVVDQRGTLFWHAHISWLRATLHGAIVIRPKDKHLIPYDTPRAEFPIILGEWWNANVEDVIAEALRTGGPYNISDALTINGQPGLNYSCSIPDTTVIEVEKGQTYLLQLVNAAINFHLYVGLGGHNLTVVNVDAEYTEPYTTDTVFLAPGQTTDVLFTANNQSSSSSCCDDEYVLGASVFSPPNASAVPFPNISATAVIRYVNCSSHNVNATRHFPSFPAVNDSVFVFNFSQNLRSLHTSTPVPSTVDEDLFFTVGYATQTCPTCSFVAFPGLRLAASINNITFSEPSLSLQQAYYQNVSGIYQGDFPSVPLFQYNYTGVNPTNNLSLLATKVKMLKFGSKVQLVLQNTATLFFENHPIHLHGQNFYIVGSGFGNFNKTTDTPNFNLVNPVFRNTVAVPAGGWVALRFTADNPGVWFMHCHFDFHTSMGMSMAFITKNGNGKNETLPPPPSDLPPC